MRALAPLFACALAAGLLPGPAAAQRPEPVDLELSFVVDASGSIDADELALQRQGYADALANPKVVEAVSGGFLRAIAITYIEFAADGCVWQRVGWTKVSDLATATAAGSAILAAPHEVCPGGNAIGDAVSLATRSTLANGFDGTRKVIDVSGDGPDTTGMVAVEDARDAAIARGFTINGLVIKRPSMPDLPVYYKRAITGGPRSFVVMAESRATFAEAILKKLILEIADRGADTGVRERQAAR